VTSTPLNHHLIGVELIHSRLWLPFYLSFLSTILPTSQTNEYYAFTRMGWCGFPTMWGRGRDQQSRIL